MGGCGCIWVDMCRYGWIRLDLGGYSYIWVHMCVCMGGYGWVWVDMGGYLTDGFHTKRVGEK